MNIRASEMGPDARLRLHFHDTRGTAIANVAQALELGVSAFDSSAGSNASKRSSVIEKPVGSSGAKARSARPCTQI